MSPSVPPDSAIRHAVVRISKLAVSSYVLDWVFIIGVAGIGGGFGTLEPSQRPFYLEDPSISLPLATHDTVSSAVLVIIGLVIPAVVILALTILLVPSPRALKGAPVAVIWRRKIWEWNAGWMGLGLSLAATYCATQGLKDLIGKPRPDMLARCDPDTSDISKYAVSGLGQVLPRAPTYVTLDICRNQASFLRNAGFAAWPSGHASFSFAGMVYLTLWFCAKFFVAFPYLGPLPFGAKPPAANAAAGLASANNGTACPETSKAAEEGFGSPQSTLPSPSPRNQGAAPPVYLQVIAFVPICVAFFVACSRYHDHRHAGFDIISGSVIGIFFAYIGFHMYHVPLRRSDGWAWSARSRRTAFFRSIGFADLTATEGWAADSPVLPTVETAGARSEV